MITNDDAPSGAKRLVLQGDLTIYRAAELKTQVLSVLASLADPPELELDLAQVTEIDTAGLQVLLLLKRESSLHNKTLRIVSPGQPVRDLLGLYNLAAYLGITPPP
jgi:anti-anti-sigma factor